MDFFQTVLRPFLFSALRADPEDVSQLMIHLLGLLDPLPISSLTQGLRLTDPRLAQEFWGLKFPNPVGLAAGLDKDGIAAGAWSWLGFGFAELGTITAHPQPGNPRPRLFRLPEDRAALNRMGFNNQGAGALARRLHDLRSRGPLPIPLGVNLGKSKVTPLEEAASDYLTSFRQLKLLGDYFVINVSSPNTPGLQSLQAAAQLDPILAMLQQENQGTKPLLLKISPDLEDKDLESLLAVVHAHQLSGIIATNTTLRREGLSTRRIPRSGLNPTQEAGGISGAPLRARSTAVIRFLRQRTELPIIGVGGIFTSEDAWEKLQAGANLIQLYTGWTYQGPATVRQILTGLLQKVEQASLPSIAAATSGHNGFHFRT